jgi:predicted aldo/keto reductase-like oxidoreductase
MLVNLRNFWKRFPAQRFATGWIHTTTEGARGCIECGECEDRCPYRFPIREMIQESLEFYEEVVQGTHAAQRAGG